MNWAAIASLIGVLIVAFGAEQETATQVTGIIMAAATMIAYIIGEGLVDAQGVGGADKDGNNDK